MDIKVSLKDADKAAALLVAIRGQLSYALAVALTSTAQQVKRDIEAEMPRAFDSPTSWTLNSLRLQAARKNNLQAVVAVKDRAARGNPALFWLAPEVYGGDRSDKRAEMALKTAGLLPSGMQVVPGREAALNRFGNMTKGAISKAVRGAKASEDGLPQDARAKYFVMRKGGQPIGIAARFSKKRMGMVMAFVNSGRYRQRLDFYGIGHASIRKNYSAELHKAIKHAIETAR